MLDRGKTQICQRLLLVGVATIAIAVGLGACGGSVSSTSTGAEAAKATSETTATSSSAAGGGKPATGSPITVGMIGTIGTSGENAPDYPAAVQAGVTALNEEGGIHNHPVKVSFCNDNANPNTAEDCARQMVSEHVAGTIADLSEANPVAVSQILDKSGIPQIGLLANSPWEFSCKSCFPFDANQIGVSAGVIQGVKDERSQDVYIARLNLPLTTVIANAAIKAAAKLGIKIVGNTAFDYSIADYSPIAAKIMSSGARYVYLITAQNNAIQLIKALQQVGYTGKFLMSTGLLTEADFKKLGAPVERMIAFGSMPPFSASKQIPAVATFLNEMKAEYERGDQAANPATVTLLAMQAWVAFHGWVQVAEKLKKVTPETILKGFSTAKDLDRMGLSSPWSPSVSAGIPGAPKISDPVGWLTKVQASELVLSQNKPINVEQLLK